jgi:hypothetical protein
MDVAFLALDHGVAIVADGAQLSPFAVVEEGKERTLVRAHDDKLDGGLAWLRQHIRDRSELERAAVAFDGFLTVDGRRAEAVLVEASERGSEWLVLAQRYEWQRSRSPAPIRGHRQSCGCRSNAAARLSECAAIAKRPRPVPR